MGLLPVMTEWFGVNAIADMAERVAGRSRLAVWQRVVDRLPKMGPTESRGYIRARAILTVHAETDRLIEQEGQKIVRHRERIAEEALAILIATITSQMQQRQSYAVVGRRAA